MSQIQLEHVSCRLGEFDLQDISMTVNSGEFFILLGPTGAGKTILLEGIAGFHKINGSIMIGDREVTGVPPDKRNIGFGFQDYTLFPHLTVEKNIRFGLKYRNISGVDATLKVKEQITVCRLQGLEHRMPDTLSGGERQRVTLARALVIQPEVLLLDEPLSALDERIKESLREQIRQITRTFNVTVIYVTHDQTEAAMLGDRIGVIMNGRMIQTGTPSEIFYQPVNEEVAAFVGMENIMEGAVSSYNDGITTVNIDNSIIHAAGMRDIGRSVRMCLRPEDIILSPDVIQTSARNMIKGTIIRLSPHGTFIRARIDCGFPLTVLITRRSMEDLGLSTGSKVYASFKASAVHMI
jgi:molybdate/tungstate transport system ATP-binding protein